jgi:hypothetical protein
MQTGIFYKAESGLSQKNPLKKTLFKSQNWCEAAECQFKYKFYELFKKKNYKKKLTFQLQIG